MRSILHNLPIRWQITVLHATILAVVLAAGGVALWQAQRTFQLSSLAAQQIAEARAIIPDELDPKLEASIYTTDPPGQAALKMYYEQLAAAMTGKGEDVAAARKRIALLDPQLADRAFPPGEAMPAPDEVQKIITKLLFQLFPPEADPMAARAKLIELAPDLAAKLYPEPVLNQAALQAYAQNLARQLSAKDRGAALSASDGTTLVHASAGSACPSPTAPAAGADKLGGDAFYQKLRLAHAFEQIAAGQLRVVLPVIWLRDRPLALAQICVPTASIDAGLNQLAASLIVGWLLVVGLATGLGVTATRRVLKPLDLVVATTDRIAAGDLQQRVGLPPGRTEIARLGAAFDAMVTRLEAAFMAQRRFVADAAHELRTPLTALSTAVELLMMGAADGDRAMAQRLLGHLDSELSRVIRLANDLLTLSQIDARPQVALCPTNLTVLLAEVGEYSRTLLRGQELIVDVAADLWVRADADRLRQVLLNLLDNARKHTPAGGQIAVRGESSAQTVAIVVEDTGAGIPADALPHLFERFYRVDGARTRASGGSGLGLAIVQGLVQAHSGEVGVESALGRGTRVMIHLPSLA